MIKYIVKFILGMGALALLTQSASAQWIKVSSDLTNNGICLAANGSNIFAGTDGNGMFLSTDNGTSWIAVNSGLPNPHVNCLAVSGSTTFAGIDTNGVFMSTNNGASWSAVNSGLTNTTVTCFAVNNNDILAGTMSGTFLSTNNGTNWNAAGLDSNHILSLAISGNNIFAGVNGKGVFLSTNNGTSWIAINNGLTVALTSPVGSYGIWDAWGLAINRGVIFAGTDSGVFVSVDNGVNWNPSGYGITNAVSSFAVSGNRIFAGENGVSLSTNNGISWTAVDSGITYNAIYSRNNIVDTELAPYSVSSITVNDNYIFAGVDNLKTYMFAVWRRPLSEMVAVKYAPPSNQISKPLKIVRTEYYNLNGQRLTVKNNKPVAPVNTIIIVRKIDVNGMVYPAKMIVK